MARENMELAQIEDQKRLNELYTQIEKGGEFEGDITVGELQQTIEDLQGTVDSLNKQLEQEKADKAKLEEEITELHGRIEDLEQEVQAGKEAIAEKEKEIENLNTELANKNKELEEKNQKIKELEENVKKLKEQITNLNNQVADLKKKVSDLEQQVADLKEKQATGNAQAGEVLKGKTFSNGSQVGITGTMQNNNAVSATLNAGKSYTIPAGYHNGSGKVTAKDLASQTQGTATADDIAKGKTAWVKGEQITGNGSGAALVYYLGTGTSFDVKNIPGFNSFTADNFIVGAISAPDTLTTNYSATAQNVENRAAARGFTVTKTYDNKTGVLSLGGTSQVVQIHRNTEGYYTWTSTNQNMTCFAYLVIGNIQNK